MKKKIILAPINPDTEGKVVFVPIREFPTEKMILLCKPEGVVRAEKLAKEMDNLGIPASIIKVKDRGNIWEDYFTIVTDVLEGQNKDDIVINISSADRISQCALTNAAHVNGIRALAVIEGKVMVLPILKLSYSNMLSDKKVKILQVLNKGKCSGSLEELSKDTEMSIQLVSYHIHGSAKSKGLKELELVELEEKKGRTKVCLSTMGRLFMKGYIGK